MLRTTRMTDALRGRRGALIAVAAAAASLAGAGTASAATTHSAATPHATVAKHVAQHKPWNGRYRIYDSVTPSAIPAHHEIATYATGAYAVPASHVAGKKVVWIDTNGTDPHANALDVEPGDVTPAGAATWAQAKLAASPKSIAIIYTMRSDWAATRDAIDTLPQPMRTHVRWWIADPTGVPHIVPGAQATQWYWGPSYDISTAAHSF
jgi:hypothetical protein